ncbi:hypothetical protein D3C87_110830 [compost metagenome]
MPNRFIFSLRFSTKVFWKLGMLSLMMVFFMTLFRANLYFLSVFHATPDAVPVEIFQSFLAGIRFDLLVFGFILIPIYFLLMIQAMLEKWPRSLFYFYKFYFSFVWAAVCSVTFVDFFFFSRYGRHMRFADYMNWTPEKLTEQSYALQSNQTLIYGVITALLLALGFMLIKAIKFGDWKDEYSPTQGSKLEVLWRVFLPLILVFLAARGTVEPHHLELAHSEVSNNTVINEMALNAVWCFDK